MFKSTVPLLSSKILRFLLGVSCCGLFSSAAPLRAAEGDQVIIGLVTKTEVNPFFVKMRQAAEAEAQKQGAKLIARAGKFDGDNEGQVAAIESLVSAGAKASRIGAGRARW